MVCSLIYLILTSRGFLAIPVVLRDATQPVFLVDQPSVASPLFPSLVHSMLSVCCPFLAGQTMANVTICPVHFDGMLVPQRLDRMTRNE